MRLRDGRGKNGRSIFFTVSPTNILTSQLPARCELIIWHFTYRVKSVITVRNKYELYKKIIIT